MCRLCNYIFRLYFSMIRQGMQTGTITNLYRWYVDTYVGGEAELEGREMVFQHDLPDEEKTDGEYDFGFLTTKIELNEQNEIVYMEHVYVPWA